ncbi:Amino acid adenylation domain-containing protein [Sulfidibacter corallicola]|uniref:Amino acid adenylation domain-containing protein n=1 Tax=Sulfidibacter corallicola TaxID=2818388 RepID=A0A8A4TJD5_SULCO|nr:non-ribosomal peptide synthetase/type I polyketide synthase [Sulfidibacter corallicola]QTD50139.1 amino acid adenylation domain-containing protein [Sulfidibacter corallicola]
MVPTEIGNGPAGSGRRGHEAASALRLPLTPQQRQLVALFTDQPEAVRAYIETLVVDLVGPLDLNALKQALSTLVARHPALRMRLDVDHAAQIVEPVLTPRLDIEHAGDEDEPREAFLERLLRQSMDLTQAPLVRFALLRIDKERAVLVFRLHHLMFDGESANVLLQELFALYRAACAGGSVTLPNVTDYQSFCTAEGKTPPPNIREYWRASFTDDLDSLTTALGGTPRSHAGDQVGGSFKIPLPQWLVDRLETVATHQGKSRFTAFFAACTAYLHRRSGLHGLRLGYPASRGRKKDRRALLAFAVDVLPLVSRALPEDTFETCIQRVGGTLLAHRRRQQAPLASSVPAAEPFEVTISASPLDKAPQAADGLQARAEHYFNGAIKYDLQIEWEASENGTSLRFDYARSSFAEGQVRHLARGLCDFLKGLCDAPQLPLNRVPLTTKGDYLKRMACLNDSFMTPPPFTHLIQGFEEMVRRHPTRPAAIFGPDTLSYALLDKAANALACRLSRRAIGLETPVAVLAGVSAEYLVGILAVLKRGGTYVPIDPEFPPERIAFMARDSRASLVLHATDVTVPSDFEIETLQLPSIEDLLAQDVGDAIHPPPACHGDNAAYVMYTSGSTGTPKGVVVTHRNVLGLVFNRGALDIQPGDRVAHFANTAFDATTFEIWSPLLKGAALVGLTKDEVLDPHRFAAAMRRFAIDAMFITSALFNRTVAKVPDAFATVRAPIVGGEALVPTAVRTALTHGTARIVNGYGPTECTTFAVMADLVQVAEQAKAVPLGTPIANTRVHLLDTDFAPVGAGMIGELCIGGNGVARGYLHRPSLTAAAFIPDPFADQPGARLYRTGDLALLDDAGQIHFKGRRDHQIKLRGFRIELGEIENVLLHHDRVAQAYVAVEKAPTGDPVLVAWIAGDNELAEAEVRVYLAGKLPGYMQPGIILILDELPLGPTGKLHRKLLPNPGFENGGEQDGAHTPIQRRIRDLLADLLEQPNLGLRDHFLAMGGHSLLAARAVAQIRREYGIAFNLRDFFEDATAAAIAAKVAVAQRNKGLQDRPPLQTVARDQSLPLSHAQQAMWFLNRLHPESAMYNMPLRLRMPADVDRVALERALGRLCTRHEALRTIFPAEDGKPRHVICERLTPRLELVRIDRGRSRAAAQHREGRRPFDLERGPLIRATLYRGDDDAELLLNLHHIIADGATLRMLVDELVVFYEAEIEEQPANLAPLPLQYADFAAHQHRSLTGENLERQLQYWLAHLEGPRTAVDLAPHKPPSGDGHLAGTYAELTLPNTLSEALDRFCRQRDLTAYHVCLAAYVALLHLQTGLEDVIVGTPFSLRNADEAQGVAGCFVNTLVPRFSVSSDQPFDSLLRTVRDTSLAAHDHGELPFEVLVDRLPGARATGRNPLFQVLFDFHPDLGAVHRAEPVDLGAVICDFSLSVWGAGGDFRLRAEYTRDRFDEGTVLALLRRYRRLLAAAIAEPATALDKLPVLDAREAGIAAMWPSRLPGVSPPRPYDDFLVAGGSRDHLRLLFAELKRQNAAIETDFEPFAAQPTFAHCLAMLHQTTCTTHEEDPMPNEAPAAVRDASRRSGDVAVIGMAGRFTGTRNIEEYWRDVLDKMDNITHFTEKELIAAGVPREVVADPNYVKAKGKLDDVDAFDAEFFNIPPREAQLIDPQQRLFLEHAWTALEKAGYDPDRYPGTVGVYAGRSPNYYFTENLIRNPLLATVDSMKVDFGNFSDFVASKVSYVLDLKGPSVNVQASCATALVAIGQAYFSLVSRQCDMALAGAVSVLFPHVAGYDYREGSILSPDGACRAFDEKARGMVIGEGVGVIVLKRMEDALRDGDQILSVIKGAAINNDGSDKVGFTAPGTRGQYEVVRAALKNAGVDARDIGFVEAHGTGTVVGDPIEMEALTQAYRKDTAARQYCCIGSVKPTIGHTDSASGVSGFIAATLCLRDKVLHPTNHFEKPNPKLKLETSPFFVATEPTPWQIEDGRQRLAAVSSFGVGGTNAHIILGEAPPREAGSPSRTRQLIPLSARTAGALDQMTDNLAEHLARTDDDLADIAYSLQVGRKGFEHRRFLIASNPEQAADILRRRSGKDLFSAKVASGSRTLAFMFSGQGSQYPDMGRELYEHESVFRETIDYCADHLLPILGLDMRDLLYPRADRKNAADKLNETRYTQPILFSIEYALAQLWISWGVLPQMLIGHSMGEYAAACVAGVMSLEDALALVAERGRLTQSLPNGAMTTVSLPAEQVAPLLSDDISVGVINSPDNCVVSGMKAGVEAFEAKLTEMGVDFRRLRISNAFHSVSMEPVREDFLAAVARADLKPPRIPFISCLTGDWITEEQATDPQYWWEQMKGSVQFAKSIQMVMETPDLVLLEVGPGRTLTTLTRRQINRDNPPQLLTSVRHPKEEQSDVDFLMITLGKLWLAGIDIPWEKRFEGERRLRLELPTYPFERTRYWVDPPSDEPEEEEEPKLRKDPDPANWCWVPNWTRSPRIYDGELDPDQPEAWLLFLDNKGVGAAVRDRLLEAGQHVVTVTPGAGFAELDYGEYTLHPARPEDYEILFEELSEREHTPTRLLHFWSVTGPGGPKDPAVRFEKLQERGFKSLLYCVRALDLLRAETDPRITVFANHLFEIDGEEPLMPEKNTLLAFCRVLSQEHPHLRCRAVELELPEEGTSPAWTQELVAEAFSEAPEPVVAFRGGLRYAEDFAQIHLGERLLARTPFKSKGVYFVTGGQGYLGFELGALLAEKYQARLALVGRSPLPPRAEWDAWLADHAGEDDKVSFKIEQMRRLEALGAKVLMVTADAADPAAMAAAMTQTELRFDHIDGVLHAAGITDESHYFPIKQTDDANVAFHFAPKVGGIQVLDRLLAERQMDFVLCFSSIAAVLGGLGFINYAAANLYMDAFVHLRNRDSAFPWISVNWDGWLVGDLEEEAARAAEDSLLALAMTMPEGLDITERILAQEGLSQVVTSTGDLRMRIDKWVRLCSLRHDADDGDEVEGTGAEQADQAPAPSGRHARPDLSNAYEAPENAFEEKIAEIWQDLLGVAQVGIHDNFFELGGDSLLAVHLSSRIHKALGVEMTGGSLLAAQTVSEQADLVMAKVAEEADPELLAELSGQ